MHQWDCSFGSVIWQAYHRNATSLYRLYSNSISPTNQIQGLLYYTAGCTLRSHANAARATNQNQALHGLVGIYICACAVEQEPRIQPKFTRPFSSFWGWGLGTRLPTMWSHLVFESQHAFLLMPIRISMWVLYRLVQISFLCMRRAGHKTRLCRAYNHLFLY